MKHLADDIKQRLQCMTDDYSIKNKTPGFIFYLYNYKHNEIQKQPYEKQISGRVVVARCCCSNATHYSRLYLPTMIYLHYITVNNICLLYYYTTNSYDQSFNTSLCTFFDQALMNQNVKIGVRGRGANCFHFMIS